MEEQLITFETAKLANKKGFNIICLYRYNTLGKLTEGIIFDNKDIPAPTQTLLQKWLREKHNLHIAIHYHKSTKYDYVVDNSMGNGIDCGLFYDSFEEALEDSLYKALQLIPFGV